MFSYLYKETGTEDAPEYILQMIFLWQKLNLTVIFNKKQ